MFTFDRETGIIVAVIVCVIASVYMYKELKTAKKDLEEVKGFNGKLTSFLSRPPQTPQTPQTVSFCKKEDVKETQVEEEIEEIEVSEEDSLK
jgi:hypothetical protein